MNKRRTIMGLGMLCALLLSAFAAQSASAITGTTGFTCVKGGGDKALRGEHCLTTGAAAQEYGHVAIEQDKTTEIIATNGKTASGTTEATKVRLKASVGGTPVELVASELTGQGWVENKVAASGEHYTLTHATITFTEVEVAKPEGRGCKVYTDNEEAKTEGEVGVIHTRELKGTTEAQGDFFKYEAADGGAYANFFLTCEEGKKIPGCEGTLTVTGSVKATPEGTTSNLTHAATTTQGTLFVKGNKAGIDGSLTLSVREKGGGAYTPVAQTTVTT